MIEIDARRGRNGPGFGCFPGMKRPWERLRRGGAPALSPWAAGEMEAAIELGGDTWEFGNSSASWRSIAAASVEQVTWRCPWLRRAMTVNLRESATHLVTPRDRWPRT